MSWEIHSKPITFCVYFPPNAGFGKEYDNRRRRFYFDPEDVRIHRSNKNGQEIPSTTRLGEYLRPIAWQELFKRLAERIE